MYKYIYAILLLIALGSLPEASAAQELPAIHYTRENGLPTNIVYNIYRDSKGLLWFATDRGITRYNGIDFETFTTYDGLPDNEIFSVSEDASNRLWIMSFTGELCYYQDGIFYTAANSPFLRQLPKGYANSNMHLEQDSSFTLYAAESSNLLNIRGQQYQLIPLKQIKARANLYQFIKHFRKLSPTTFEVEFGEKRFEIDTLGNILTVKPPTSPALHNWIAGEREDNFITADGIYSANGQVVYAFKKGMYPKGSIKSYYAGNNNVLLGTSNGLVINGAPPVLKGNTITAIVTDPAGNYWVSTLSNGAFCFSKDLLHTRIYKNSYSGVARFAFTDNDALFFATDNNNFYRNFHDKTAILFNYKKASGTHYKYAVEPGFFVDDAAGYNSFYGQEHIIIDSLHAALPKITRRPIQTDSTPATGMVQISAANGIKYITCTPAYIYFVFGGHWILRIDRYRSAKEGITTLTALPLNAQKKRIFAMAKDAAQHLWYTTIDSMYKIVDTIAVNQPQFNNIGFKRFYIYDSCLIGWTHQNKLLVCHNIYGKIKTDSITGQNTIWSRAYQIDRHHILLKTNNQYRILTIQPSGYSIHIVEDPFIPEEADCISANSTTSYFLKNGHITSISTQQLLAHTLPSTPVFIHLKTQEAVYPTGAGRVTIPYHARRNITVAFKVLGFNNRQLTYEYTISKNNSDNWQELKEEKINLFTPGFGDYTIKVRTKNLSGNASTPAILLLTITRPFWATWWFILLFVVCAFLLLYVFVHYIVNYFLRKREHAHTTEMKFLQSEFKALNALMNPHFIFNSLNNIQGLFNDDNKRTANEYLRIFADLIRQNMLNISQERISLQKEMDLVVNYLKLEKLRFGDDFNYSIEIDENVEPDFIYIPPLLVQPLVENSIRHGLLPRPHPGNLVSIRIYEEEDILYIQVRDNGIGLTTSRQHKQFDDTSFALGNMEKRLAKLQTLHHQHITFHIREMLNESGIPEGTLAVITLHMESPLPATGKENR
jgi:hypothetical protein